MGQQQAHQFLAGIAEAPTIATFLEFIRRVKMKKQMAKRPASARAGGAQIKRPAV
jgi:hypothetical protein